MFFQKIGDVITADDQNSERGTRVEMRTQKKLSNRDEQIVDVRVQLPILKETVSVMKLAPHEHAHMTQKTAEFLQPQFINKVVDDRVKVQRQVPQSKWR